MKSLSSCQNYHLEKYCGYGFLGSNILPPFGHRRPYFGMDLTKHVLYHAREYRHPRPIDFLANQETTKFVQFQNRAIELSQVDKGRKVRGFSLEIRVKSVSVINQVSLIIF